MTALNILTHKGALVVSSETIAEGSGVQHKNVLELILANHRRFLRSDVKALLKSNDTTS